MRFASAFCIEVQSARRKASHVEKYEHDSGRVVDVGGELIGVPTVLGVPAVCVDAAEDAVVDGVRDLMMEAVASKCGVVRLDIVVVVPRLALPVPQLDVAHTALKQAARDERLAPVGFASVEVTEMIRLRAQVKGVARLHLHAVGEFECLDACIELWIAHAIATVFGIQLGEKIELGALLLGSR